jgi:hypothetical protein
LGRVADLGDLDGCGDGRDVAREMYIYLLCRLAYNALFVCYLGRILLPVATRASVVVASLRGNNHYHFYQPRRSETLKFVAWAELYMDKDSETQIRCCWKHFICTRLTERTCIIVCVFFRIAQYIGYTHNARTHTHPYEYTHANPTPRSIF